MFVSSTDTDDWQADPEIPGSEVHVFVEADGVQAGMTRALVDQGPLTWTSTAREVLLVLEGAVRIEFAEGPPLELTVGDMASIPEGLETTWHVTTPFKELWMLG